MWRVVDPGPFEPQMPQPVRALLQDARAGRGPLTTWLGDNGARDQLGASYALLRGHPEPLAPEIVGWAVGIALFGDDLHSLPRVITREHHRAPIPFALDAVAVGLAARVPTTPRQWKSIETLVAAHGAVPPSLAAVLPLGLSSDRALDRGAALRLAQRAGASAREATARAREQASSKKEQRRLDEALAALDGSVARDDDDGTDTPDDPAVTDHEAELLARLVAAWGETRDPRLVEPAARLGERVARRRGPLGARSKGELEGAWLALAAARDVADVDRLTRAPWPRLWKPALARVQALATMPPDPRIVRAVLAQATQHSSLGSYPLHVAIASLVARMADPAAVELVEAARASRARERTYDAALTACKSAIAREADAALVAEALGATRPSEDLEALWRAFWEDPREPTRRLVLADALSTAGDPRGELIALEDAMASGRGTPTMQRRARSLLDAYADTWCGPIPELERGTRRFVGGFLVEARCMASAAAIERTIDALEWRTIEVLALDAPGGCDAILSRMPCLRALTIDREGTATRLWSGEPLPLRALCIDQMIRDFVPAGPATGLPALEVLVGRWPIYAWRWEADGFRMLSRSLAHARVPAVVMHDALARVPLRDALAIWRDAGPDTLCLTDGGERFSALGWVLCVRRASRTAELSWSGRGSSPERIAPLLSSLADSGFERARVHAGAASAEIARPLASASTAYIEVSLDGAPLDLLSLRIP